MDEINWVKLPVNKFFTIHQRWDELNKGTINQGVLSALFVQNLIDVFGNESLVVLCEYRGKKLIFSGIFEQTSRFRWSIFQTSQGPLGAILSQEKLLSRSHITEVGKQLGGAFLIDFTQLDSSWFRNDDTRMNILPYITTGSLKVPIDFDDYFSKLSKNTRQNINKAKNRLKKEDVTISLSIITSPDEIENYVEHYGKLESRSWKNELGTAVSIENEQGQFYVSMLKAMAEKGIAQIWCYRFNDVIVAVDLCIVHNKAITILKTTFDESFARYSPALLMKVDAYRQMSENKEIKEIEYYGKVMDWHRRLACDERPLFHLTWAKSQTIYRSLNWLKMKLNDNN